MDYVLLFFFQRDTTGQGQQLGGQAVGGSGFQQPQSHGAHNIQVMDEQGE